MPTYNKSKTWIRIHYKFLIILFIYFLFYLRENKNYTIAFDSFGYYAYLPAIFHLHDVRLKDTGPLRERHKQECKSDLSMYQIYQVKDSPNSVIRYPIGMAISYFPAFIVSYTLSEIFGIDHEMGFNMVYKKILFYYSFLISIMGLVFLYLFLNYYFRILISTITVGLIVFGTNYWLHSYMYGHGIMSQNYLFSYYVLLVYCTHHYYKSLRYIWLTAIVTLICMISISRNSEIFCFLIPLLYGIKSINDVFIRIKEIFSKKIKLVVTLLPGLFIIAIQISYWKLVTGQFLYYSYQDNPGEKLDILSPYLLEVCLSFRKGLFIYTPLALVMIWGLREVYLRYKQWSWSFILFSIVNFYIISSWTCWWYSESFGQRAIIPMYSIWAFGLAALTDRFLNLRNYKRIFYTTFISLCLLLNVFQTWQVDKGILATNLVTRDYYCSVFGQTTLPDESQKSLLLAPDLVGIFSNIDSSLLLNLEKEFIYSTFSAGSAYGDSEHLNHRRDSQILNQTNQFSNGITIPNKYLNNSDFKMIKITAWVGVPETTDQMKFGVVAHRITGRKFYGWHISSTPADLFKEKKFHKLTYWYMASEIQRNDDVFRTYVWNLDGKDLIVYGVEAEVYKPRARKKIFLF